MDIRFEKRPVLKEKPDQKNLGFGKYMTDYMFVMDWTKEDGWKDARIVPEGPITMDPACVTLHYAQETFEGMKAYRTAEGKIQLFRPEMNAKRMINSNARLCMPEFPVDMFVEAVEALVKVEADWVPSEPNTSLYIRPFMFATEAALGVHMANAYKFMIICCPAGTRISPAAAAGRSCPRKPRPMWSSLKSSWGTRSSLFPPAPSAKSLC